MKVLLIFLIFMVSVIVCDENNQESNMRLPQPGYLPGYPGGKPGYPVAEQVYPGGKPGYPSAEPENGLCGSIYPGNATDQLKYWRLFFEGPDSFGVTPAVATTMTLHAEDTCTLTSPIAYLLIDAVVPTSKTCNGPLADIGPRNFTINGGTGYLYFTSQYSRFASLNGNTIEGAFGQVSQSNPASCVGTYYLRITIYRANDQLECTNSGLSGQQIIFNDIYFYGTCASTCVLNTGAVSSLSLNPTISITGAGPAKQLP